MGFCFGRRSDRVSERIKEDQATIDYNCRSTDVLIAQASGNKDLVTRLEEMKEVLKYLTASDLDRVFECDKKIGNRIGDLKIALTKSSGEPSQKIDDIISDIGVAVAERNAFIG